MTGALLLFIDNILSSTLDITPLQVLALAHNAGYGGATIAHHLRGLVGVPPKGRLASPVFLSSRYLTPMTPARPRRTIAAAGSHA